MGKHRSPKLLGARGGGLNFGAKTHLHVPIFFGIASEDGLGVTARVF